MTRTIVESPYAGDVELNLQYLRACMADCIRRHESPYASHGLLTQPGVLDDLKPEERSLGISAGFAWAPAADLIAVYIDRGISTGMSLAIQEHVAAGRTIDYRSLPEWSQE